jgi:iron(III) transport system permease protein
MYRASYDRSAAAVISFVLIAFSILFVMANESISGRSTSNQLLKSLSVKTPQIQKAYLKVATVLMIVAFAIVAVIVPFYVLLTRFFSNPVAIDWASLASATISTVSVAALGAFIALVLSAPLGYLLSGAPSRFATVTNKMVVIAHALPGVVVGLALVSIGSKLGGLYQTTFLLALAYAILFLAKSVTSMSSSLARVPNGVKDVAATLGMNQWAVVKKVIAPIAAPGIGIGTILVFLTAMKELPATLMLRPTGFETLATQIWSSGSINRFNEAAPYALILVLVAAIPTFLISRPDKQEQSFNSENAGGPSERP